MVFAASTASIRVSMSTCRWVASSRSTNDWDSEVRVCCAFGAGVDRPRSRESEPQIAGPGWRRPSGGTATRPTETQSLDWDASLKGEGHELDRSCEQGRPYLRMALTVRAQSSRR